MEATKEKKRKIPGYVWAIVIIAILVGIFKGDDILEEEFADIRGKRNAIEYIEKKYGFTPKIRSIECERYSLYFPFPRYLSSYVYVDMSYNGKNFSAYVYHDGDEIEGYDNYQYNEIMAGFESEIENLIGGDIEFSTLCYGREHVDSDDGGFAMVETYYDGTNLAEVLGNAKYNEANIGYLEGSMKDVTEEEFRAVAGKNARYTFVKPQDEETCDFLKGYAFHDCERGYPSVTEMEIYLDEYAGIFFSEWEYVKCDKYETTGIYCMLREGTFCNATELSLNEAENLNLRLIAGVPLEQTCKMYSFDTDARTVYTWIPKELIDSNDTENRQKRAFWIYFDKDGTTKVEDEVLELIYGEEYYYTGNYAIDNEGLYLLIW